MTNEEVKDLLVELELTLNKKGFIPSSTFRKKYNNLRKKLGMEEVDFFKLSGGSKIDIENFLEPDENHKIQVEKRDDPVIGVRGDGTPIKQSEVADGVN